MNIENYSYYIATELAKLIPHKYDLWYENISKDILLKNISNDIVVIIINDNLFGATGEYYIWGETRNYGSKYLIDLISRHPDKKFIIFSSVENLEKELSFDNLFIVPIGGCITKQAHMYPLTTPVLDKNLDSSTSFISLNNNAKPARILSVNYIFGNDLHQFGYISYLDPQFFQDYLDVVMWKFDPGHQHKQKLLSQGQTVLKNYPQSHDSYAPGVSGKGPDNVKNFSQLRNRYKNSFIEVVAETTCPEPAFLMTEKYLNSIYACNFPIIIGSRGVVKFLREFGFDVFDDVIDHSYDLIENPIDRIFAAYDLNMSLLKDVAKVKNLWLDRRDRFQKNVDFARKDMYNNYMTRAHRIFLELGLDK